MAVQFNADEIFEIAIQIENNGYKFYKDCALKIENEEIKNLLITLAEAEEKHEMIFKTMHDSFKASNSFVFSDDADDIRLHYLQTVASGYIFDLNVNPLANMGSNIKIDQILKIALDREKDTVVFFVSMKEMVSDEKGRKSIDRIISEEIEHVVFITKEINHYCQK
ncbi:ferritin family protein [bacterium]|nr:ferritin family protein [bacterium]